MANVVFEKQYKFIPPHRGNIWPKLIQCLLPRAIRKSDAITNVECTGIDLLQQSIAAGNGILLTPNHARPCDPQIMGMLSRATRKPFFVMASAHLFHMNWKFRLFLPLAGAFSVYREGMDKAAITEATTILETGERPLVMFPEGHITRANDRLDSLMEGVSFIARSAAKKLAKSDDAAPAGATIGKQRQVVVHPVFIRYKYHGTLDTTVATVLTDIEKRLSLQPQTHRPAIERVRLIGRALLAVKEVEYLGAAQQGSIEDRLKRLVDGLLDPLEKEWLAGKQEGSIMARVKKLRAAILPDMINSEVDEAERARRWRQLNDLYFAQQLSNYHADYLDDEPSIERTVETIERFEEDLIDKVTIHGPWTAHVEVAPAIPVSPGRQRGAEGDALMTQIEASLQAILDKSTRR